MFGALKLHGPIITTVDGDNNLSGVDKNPYTWARKHNVIYIDNPVGAGDAIFFYVPVLSLFFILNFNSCNITSDYITLCTT